MMIRTTLLLAFLVSLLIPCINASAGDLPDQIREAFDKHVIGNWQHTTEFGGQTTKQLVVSRWLPGKKAVLSINFDVEGSEPSAAYSLLGWDEASKAIISHGFGSAGNTWTITYDKVSNTGWTGHGVGTWKDQEWKSPATIEFSKDGFRYEDITEGKPFIITGKRISAGDPKDALKQFGGFMAGTWTRTDEGQERVHNYNWGLKRKFLRSNGRKDPIEAWDGLIGIDHGVASVGWWGYFEDGTTGVCHLVNAEDDAWTFVGEVDKPDGTYHRLIVIKKLAENRLQSNVLDTKDGKSTTIVEDEIWERKSE